jgi:hypothetical protein
MKGLRYLDYVKTPDAWKASALDIPNRTQTAKLHRSFRPSAVLVACAVVLSLSGVGVYAVGNGALASFQSKLFKGRTVPYSYSGSYNDTLELSDLEEYFNTSPKVENLEVSGELQDFQVDSYLCDRDKSIVILKAVLPEGGTVPSTSDCYTVECVDDPDLNVSKTCLRTERVEDGVTYLSLEFDGVGGRTYHVSVSGLGSYDGSGDYTDEYELNASFDLTLEDCGLAKTVSDLDQTVTLNNGTTTTLKSISYSPLGVVFRFDDTPFEKRYVEYNGATSKVINQFTVYYVYADGRRVFLSRDYLTYSLHYRDGLDDGDYTDYVDSIAMDYVWSNVELVDFTDVVAIEVNGAVVPLQ